MRNLGTTLAMLLAGSAVLAQVDPLRTPACFAALEALGMAEDAAVAAKAAREPPEGPGTALTAARRAVGAACLGSADLAPPAARVRPPVSVGRVAPWPSTPDPPRQAPMALHPVLQRPLLSISSCDPSGCWASDGSRLQRQGQLLLGPKGYCTALGAVLACP
jgi:hypothetical protein